MISVEHLKGMMLALPRYNNSYAPKNIVTLNGELVSSLIAGFEWGFDTFVTFCLYVSVHLAVCWISSSRSGLGDCCQGDW